VDAVDTVSAFGRVLAELETRGLRVTGSGNRRSCQCPAHEDRNPSLSITSDAEKVLVHCHAGCHTLDVLAALDLAPGDLYDAPATANGNGSRPDGVTEYRYLDEHSALLYVVERRQPKAFRQRRPNGCGGWIWKLGNVRRVPYRLPEVTAAVKAGRPVWIVEGEKDVHALEHLDQVATCNSGGAGKWTNDHAQYLNGAEVIVCRDRDNAGHRHADQVVASLADTASSIRLVEPAEGKDISDHLAAGRGLDDLVEVELPDDPENADEHATSWDPIDLAPYLDGTHQPVKPSIGLARSDGLLLLYAGKEHTVIGETESGKTWLCLACVLAVLLAGGLVVYVHFEEADPAGTVERLLALGGTRIREIIRERFLFIGPDTPITEHTRGRFMQREPAFVVLDGVNEAMALHGQAIYDPDGAAAFRRDLVKPFTRIGAAVLSADHVRKDRDLRGRDAFGSVHKGNALDGCRIELETVHPFGRGMRGKSKLYITKDRPGHHRRHGQPTKLAGKTYMGDLVVDDTQERSADLELTWWPPIAGSEDKPAGDTSLANHVLTVITRAPDRTVGSERDLYARMRKAGHKAREARIRDAVDDLLITDPPQVERVTGPNGAKGYRAVQPTSAAHNK
jgi:hypothetical protein